MMGAIVNELVGENGAVVGVRYQATETAGRGPGAVDGRRRRQALRA